MLRTRHISRQHYAHLKENFFVTCRRAKGTMLTLSLPFLSLFLWRYYHLVFLRHTNGVVNFMFSYELKFFKRGSLIVPVVVCITAARSLTYIAKHNLFKERFIFSNTLFSVALAYCSNCIFTDLVFVVVPFLYFSATFIILYY